MAIFGPGSNATIQRARAYIAATGQKSEMVLNEFISMVGDWCDAADKRSFDNNSFVPAGRCLSRLSLAVVQLRVLFEPVRASRVHRVIDRGRQHQIAGLAKIQDLGVIERRGAIVCRPLVDDHLPRSEQLRRIVAAWDSPRAILASGGLATANCPRARATTQAPARRACCYRSRGSRAAKIKSGLVGKSQASEDKSQTLLEYLPRGR